MRRGKRIKVVVQISAEQLLPNLVSDFNTTASIAIYNKGTNTKKKPNKQEEYDRAKKSTCW